MNFKVLISAILASTIAVVGCETSSDGGAAGSGGTGGGGGEGGGGEGGGEGGAGGMPPSAVDCTELPNLDAYVVGDLFDNVPVTPSDDCTGEMFLPGAMAAQRLNTRLENADPDDVICMAEGTYVMDITINISAVSGLTLKGTADSPDKTILDFPGPGSGRGIFVQTNGVRIENLWVKNTGANGIEQDGTTGSEFVKVHVSWDNADQTMNGPYGIYPTNCEDTLVEFSQATDASDAGIYVGKCGWLDDATTGGAVRYNIAARNVAGLEVENCLGVVAHDNYVVDNTGGLMPLQQPISAERPSNTGVEMYNNRVYCNNRANFASTGVVQIIPAGTGLLILGGDGVEVRDNDVQGNNSAGILVASSFFTCVAADTDCPPYGFEYNPYAQNIYMHDNNILNNGTSFDTMSPFFPLISLFYGIGTEDNPVEDIMWDGYIDPMAGDPGICLGDDNTASYRDMSSNMCRTNDDDVVWATCLSMNTTTETTGRDCVPIGPAAN